MRHKIHMGLFAAFGLLAFNWILTLSWNNLAPLNLAEPLLCTTFTLAYIFHLTSFYWMFLEGFYLFLQVHHHLHHQISYHIDLQVQFPLSLVSIKFKHFLFFGLGGPIVNTLVWFVLRLLDQGTLLDGDPEEELSKWENGTKSFLCLFVEDRKVDVYVMQVYFS